MLSGFSPRNRAVFGLNAACFHRIAVSMKKVLPSSHRKDLLATLQSRFEAHPERHPNIGWDDVLARLESHPGKLWSLHEMEITGGEPDVMGLDPESGACRFVDCAVQTPSGRTSACYDRAGLESRKEHKPRTSAMDLASEMGIDLLTETEYGELQALGDFDTKTSSWIKAPPEIRALGGALYGERRYGRVFIGHNGAQSYYAVRGFRGRLDV